MVLIPQETPDKGATDNNVVWSVDGCEWRGSACHAHLKGIAPTNCVENYTDHMKPHQLQLRDRVWGYLFDREKTPYPDIVEHLRSEDKLFDDELLERGYFAFNPSLAIVTFGLPYFRSFLTHLRTPREHKNSSFRPPIDENWFVEGWDIAMDVFDHSHTGFMLAQRVGNSARWYGRLFYCGITGHDTTGAITPGRVRHSMNNPPDKLAPATSDIFFGRKLGEGADRMDEWNLGPDALESNNTRAEVLRKALTQLKELATK